MFNQKSVKWSFLITSVLILAACGEVGPSPSLSSSSASSSLTSSESSSEIPSEQQFQIYLKAQQSGYTGTYEEWLASIKGADGTTLLSGTTNPTSSEGKNGDTFVNTITWDVFVKSGGNWTKVGNVMGPKGDTGEQGPPGVDGVDGTNGTDGADGQDGTNGTDGADGQDGTNGTDGADGQDGTNGTDGADGQDGTSVISINQTSSDGLIDTYTITYSDGSTSTFFVTNGQEGIQGVPGQDGHTPIITISEDGYWIVDGVKTDTNAQGDGAKGTDGTSVRTGNGTPVEELGADGDSYINLSNWDYYLKVNGRWVLQGNIKGTDGNNGLDGATPYIKDGYWWIGETNTGIKAEGSDGQNGNNGLTPYIKDGYWWIGNDNTNIPATGSPGEEGSTPYIGSNTNWWIDGVDTGVKAEGQDGENGLTPYIKDGYWWIGNNNTNIPATGAQGEKGDKGDTGDAGLSAYQIYIKYHPNYTGTEEQWLSDLVNGNLREKYTVTFASNGGTSVESQKISFGHLVTRPYEPTRTGYIFDGWYLNAELFPFNSYQVYSNLNLYARWKSSNVTLTLDANGGSVEYNTKIVTYGIDYVLPTPTRENYFFDGWYLNSTLLCPISGTWSFSKDNITLVARWSGTVARISFAEDSNIFVGSANYVDVDYGSYFSLPVPTIFTGDTFIGWALENGTLITDSEGDSIKKSTFTTNQVLKAIYFVEIFTPNQLLSLSSLTAGNQALKRTYVVKNDLDFTGLSNQSIANFEGVLDGGGYRVIGMSKSLFASIGAEKSANNVIIKNLVFVDFGGNSIVSNVAKVASLTISDLKIYSFKKDVNNYTNFDGLINKIGIDSINYPQTINIKNCSISDEFATINSGFINHLHYFKTLNISFSVVMSNTINSSFVSSDRLSSNPWLSLTDIGSKSIPPEDSILRTVNIDYCSNFGNTKSLVNIAVGKFYKSLYRDTTSSARIYETKTPEIFHTKVNINNSANYGNVSETLFNNSMKYYQKRTTYESTSSIYLYYFIGIPIAENFVVSKFVNFGSINQFSKVNTTNTDGWNEFVNIFYSTYFGTFSLNSVYKHSSHTLIVKNSLNAGKTNISASNGMTASTQNFYYVASIVGISEDKGLSITPSQVNADFFINTIGLDTTYWDLNYVNILDEYGLPKIKY